MARRRLLRQRIMRLSEHYAPRRWWVYPREKRWWAKFVSRIWGDEQWIKNFRMSRGTFSWLLERMRPSLERQTTHMRDTIAPDERLAIALWFLANTLSYRLVGQQFGIARSTVAGIVVDVCLAMENTLLSSVVRPGPYVEVSKHAGLLKGLFLDVL